MEKSTATFEFYGISVLVSSSCEELLERLQKDFSCFTVAAASHSPAILIRCALSPLPVARKPVGSRPVHTRNAIIRQKGALRWNDYYGKGWVVFDFKQESGEVYSESIDPLHELTYLLILSRVGKLLDQKQLHRLHAMGVARGNSLLICTMPMKGGKSTLFLNLLTRDGSLEILSDDAPLVAANGSVRAFPIRIGLEGSNGNPFEPFGCADAGQAYWLDRIRYGRKALLPLSAMRNSSRRSSFSADRLVLVRGKRRAGPDCRISRTSALFLYPSIFTAMVIGVGLPIMREHFIEHNMRDYLRLAMILLSRIRASIALLRRAETYEAVLGESQEANSAAFLSLLR